jgi:glycerol kinase
MSAAAPGFLAIDQSTSATKAILFNKSCQPTRRVTIKHRQYYPQPGRIEHDAVEILQNVREAIRQVLIEGETTIVPVVLSITNQRETVVAWDRFSGLPYGRAIVWQDQRGTPTCERLRQDNLDGIIREKTGLFLDSYFSASKLAAFVHENENAASALKAGRLMAGTMDSWLIWNLTERQVFCTDYSNASRTMLFDIFKLRWDPELIEIFGLKGVGLPEPRCSDANFGSAKLIPSGGWLPIAAVMGDSHAALFGHRGWNIGDIKATYGTGTSIMMNIGDYPLSPPTGTVISLGWGFQEKPAYVIEGNIHSTGDTVSWLKDNLGLFDSYEQAESLAAELPDNDGVYIVPAFSGLGAPYWVHGIGALITGLSRGCTRSHLVRAGMESIAYQVRDLVETMRAPVSPLACLHADGGASRNRFLMQFQADMLGVPVIASGIEELSALGTVMMAGVSTGIFKDAQTIAALPFEFAEYRPALEPMERDNLLKGWKAAVQQALAGRPLRS